MGQPAQRGIHAAQVAILVNAALAITKLAAGIFGHTYVLIADAVESTADIFSSSVVWGSLVIAARDPDEDYPFGYGKAEPLAAAVVSLMIIVAAIGIAVQAIREIQTPSQSPEPWTLLVLIAVIVAKFALSRRVAAVGAAIGSTAVKTDAWHHMSDAVTSAAAFIGISIALVAGPGWASADDWAALFASAIIAANGFNMLRPTLHDLMDRAPGPDVLEPVRRAAAGVAGVLNTEKLAVRKSGLGYRVTIHVQADPALQLDAAHILGGKVKRAIMAAVPQVQAVLVHMEPYNEERR